MPPLGPRAQPKPARRPRAAPSPPPVTDVQSSGGNYGLPKANAFKHTPQFRSALVHVFEAQPPAVQQHIVSTAVRHPTHPTSQAILEHVARRSQQAHVPDINAGADIAKANAFKRTSFDYLHALNAAGPREVDKPLVSIGPLHLGTTATYTDPATGQDVTDKVVKQQRRSALAKSSSIDKAITGVATPVLKDYVDINANAIPGLYHVASTAVTGHPGAAAKMLIQPYQQFFKDPIKTFKAHPLGTALLFAGPKGIVGRGAGNIARAAGEDTAIGRLASTQREPATLPGTTLTQTRRYSPDVITKAGQVLRERVKTSHAERLVAKAQQAAQHGDPEAAQALRTEANRVNPARTSDAEIRRRMDERVDANEQVRRVNRAHVIAQTDQALGRNPTAAHTLIAQGIVKPTLKDLATYRDELAGEYAGIKRQSLRQENVRLRGQISAALKRGGNLDDVQRAAQAYEQIIGRRQQRVGETRMLAPEQVNMAKLVPYAVRNMGARFDYQAGRLVDHEGEPLTADAIRTHMRQAGVPEPAYVNQAPGKRGAGNYFVAQHQAPSVIAGTRTGEATLKGTFSADPEVLRETAARTQGLLDAHDGFAKMLNEFGLRDGGGRGEVRTLANRRDAQAVADELAAAGHGQWRPVRAQPFLGRNAQLHDLLERTTSEGIPEHQSIRSAIETAIGHEATGPGPWALVPEAAARQLADHIRVLGSGGAGKALQKLNSVFRQTVLATSPKWLTGNNVEAAMRAAIMRAGPRSWYVGRQTLRSVAQHDPEASLELSARAVGGGHYAMADRMPRRGYEQFQGTRLEPVANALHTFWSAPGPKQAADLWHHWTDFVFHRVNQPIERQFQTAMAGRHIRAHLMDGKMLKTSHQAIDDAAKGLTATHAQVDLARAVDRAYGRYSKLSPNERRIFALYTPFFAWMRNAVHFLTFVLPQDHPVLTSLIAASHQGTQQWRRAHGLDVFEKGAAPGFLQGAIPQAGNAKLRLSRYTPFGAFGDPTGTLAGNVLPQYSGVLSAFQGQDWTGRPLKGTGGQAPNPLQKTGAAALSLAESMVPLAGQLQQYLHAPGSPAQRLRKVYDPFMATQPKAKRGAGAFNFKSAGAAGVSTTPAGFDFKSAK